MDYEKAYKEALGRARFLHKQAVAGVNPLMANRYEQIFHELAESEDEKTAREIKEFILYKAGHLLDEDTEHRFVKYLEKQKESKVVKFDHDIEQKPAEWSEDDRKRKNCIHFLELQKKYHADTSEIDDCIDYLEKQKEQKPNIELIQRSWYMEGYNDRDFGKEPKWVIKTGDGGPKYEENPKYGQMFEAKQKPVEPTCKTCVFYENDCPFTRGKFMPYPNRVCKDYTYSDMKVYHSKPFSCGHENGNSGKTEQEQPDVDIRKELGRVELMGSNNASDMQHIASHFYELGLNARKEESK